jgi:hypothetical protein
VNVETAVQDVVTAINAKTLDRGDGQQINVIDFDPMPGTLDRPCSVGVTFGALTSTDIGVVVRLYADGSSSVAEAEKLTRSLTPDLDDALDAVPAPRSPWTKTWAGELSAYVVETTLAIGREDF